MNTGARVSPKGAERRYAHNYTCTAKKCDEQQPIFLIVERGAVMIKRVLNSAVHNHIYSTFRDVKLTHAEVLEQYLFFNCVVYSSGY